MLTAKDELPEFLRPFTAHGLVFQARQNEEYLADCPFCGKEGKFTVNHRTTLWRCFVCNEGEDKGGLTRGGNAHTFLRKLWEDAERCTESAWLDSITTEWRLLSAKSLTRWGMRKGPLKGHAIVPGYNSSGRLNQLYRFTPLLKGNVWKKRMLPTPSLGANGEDTLGLFGVPQMEGAQKIFLCEGYSDGVALDEVLRRCKRAGDRLTLCGDPAEALRREYDVFAVPGTSSFRKDWSALLAGKEVTVLFDNDHVRVEKNEHGKEMLKGGAGINGARSLAALLLNLPHHDRPRSLSYLAWGGEADFDPDTPDGTDVRDVLTGRGEPLALPGRIEALGGLLSKVRPVPEDWAERKADRKVLVGAEGVRHVKEAYEPIPCESWSELVSAMEDSMSWGPGLDTTFSVCLAGILSTNKAGEDQVWLKVVGPPSSGKTRLALCLMASQKYVIQSSSFTSFYSGYKEDKEGEEDFSLAARLPGKTLLVKDADTLIRSPAYAKVMAQARDLYDGIANTNYGHGVNRDYRFAFTFFLFGTEESLRPVGTSELGERFLDVRIVDDFDELLERSIGSRVARKSFEAAATENRDCEAATPEDVKARRMTAGFIQYLRERCDEKLARVKISPEALDRIQATAELVSFLRTKPRPAKRGETQEGVEREISFRLISQMSKLVRTLAVVVGEEEITDSSGVMRRIRKVALDTARGRSLEFCKAIAEHPQGAPLDKLVHRLNDDEERVKQHLAFLRSIRAAEPFTHRDGDGCPATKRWRMTARMARLWKEVVG